MSCALAKLLIVINYLIVLNTFFLPLETIFKDIIKSVMHELLAVFLEVMENLNTNFL